MIEDDLLTLYTSKVTDLIPGSKYKFRVMAASVTGISEPSPESEEVMKQ